MQVPWYNIVHVRLWLERGRLRLEFRLAFCFQRKEKSGPSPKEVSFASLWIFCTFLIGTLRSTPHSANYMLDRREAFQDLQGWQGLHRLGRDLHAFFYGPSYG